MYEPHLSRAQNILYAVVLVVSLVLIAAAIAGDYRWWLLWL